MDMSRQEELGAKRERWRERIGEWENSGLTQAAYCREKGLALHCFLYWRKKFRPVEAVSFAEVSAPLGFFSGGGGGLIVRVRDRFAVEVHEGFSPDLLCSVLRVLEGA